MPEISPSKYVVQAGWQDVPHIDEQAQAELLASTPPWLREARTKGEPSMGAGAIYPIPIADIEVKPFSIGRFWKRGYALDVGWNKTAALWGAQDPADGTIFIYTEHYQGQQLPMVHAAAIRARGAWIQGCIDPAARGRSQRDGEKLMDEYRSEPCNLKLVPAFNEVQTGLEQVWQALALGRLKIFSTLQYFKTEYRVYRRDETGKMVKKNDHLMDCWDAETEVLTKAGWKPWPLASAADEFATVNLETDEIEYQAPTEMIARPYVGEMVRIKGHKLDALCTPNHRMVVYRRDHDEPSIRLAGDLTIWDRIKLRAKWRGATRGPVPVESAYGRPAEIDPLVWAEFLGWYVAEGWSAQTIQMPGRGYQVAVAQQKPDGIEKIRALLDRTPWAWTYRSGSFHTSCKWLWEQVNPLGLQGVRHVPQWVKDSSPDIIEAFIDGAIAGDGWTQNKSRSYATISRRLADDMQELFFKIGRTASVRVGRAAGLMTMRGRTYETQEQYWTQEWTAPYGLLRDSENRPNFSRERYAGTVYCASVPNGTLVVRRNGKPMIAGNCMRYLWMTWDKIATLQAPEATVRPFAVADRRAGM